MSCLTKLSRPLPPSHTRRRKQHFRGAARPEGAAGHGPGDRQQGADWVRSFRETGRCKGSLGPKEAQGGGCFIVGSCVLFCVVWFCVGLLCFGVLVGFLFLKFGFDCSTASVLAHLNRMVVAWMPPGAKLAVLCDPCAV